MVKKVLLCFMLGVATISSGCGKQVSSEKSNVVDMLESDDSKVYFKNDEVAKKEKICVDKYRLLCYNESR